MKYIEVEFVENIIKNLVEYPEDVSIERTVDDMGVLLMVKTNIQDIGKIIGKQGSTIQAIRALVHILGSKNKARISVKVFDPNK